MDNRKAALALRKANRRRKRKKAAEKAKAWLEPMAELKEKLYTIIKSGRKETTAEQVPYEPFDPLEDADDWDEYDYDHDPWWRF